MEDIRSILSMYRSKDQVEKKSSSQEQVNTLSPAFSELPDVFFDEILIDHKLTRVDITVLMWLYRQVWCKPNLYRDHGIGPLNSYSDICKKLHLSLDEYNHSIRSLEKLGFIQTVRAGQYFVRRFFTEENDVKFGQTYEF